MKYKTHVHVVENTTKLVHEPLKSLMNEHIEWLIAGQEVPDSFIRWNPDPDIYEKDAGKVLAHRYYVDSNERKSKGLIPHIIMYANGITSYINDTHKEPIMDSQKEQEMDWALQIGILCHLISDLSTPVHIGSTKNKELETIKKGFHGKFEAMLERRTKNFNIDKMKGHRTISINHRAFQRVAKRTYNEMYLVLPELFRDTKRNKRDIDQLMQNIFINAVLLNVRVLNAIQSKILIKEVEND